MCSEFFKFGRVSVAAEALAEADRFERMSDGELVAYGYSLANFRRDLGVMREAATVEAERRLQENPQRFSSGELKL